jgi:hypothetical protein
MGAEEAASGRGDSSPQAEEAEESKADRGHSEETVVASVAPYWARPHGRVRGVLTGHRP